MRACMRVCVCVCVCVCLFSQGGTRVRTILHSPKFLANTNKTHRGLVHITDLLPTFFVLGTGKISDLPSKRD